MRLKRFPCSMGLQAALVVREPVKATHLSPEPVVPVIEMYQRNHGSAGEICGIRIVVARRVADPLPSAECDDLGPSNSQDGARHPRAPWLARAVPPHP
jgi:hypothetical protein